MSRYKSQLQTATGLVAAIEGGFSDLADLRNECEEAADAIPESLQNGQRCETLRETVDTLDKEMPEEPDNLPEEFAKMEVSTSISLLPGKQRGRESRSVRRDNACSWVRAGIDLLRAWCDEQEAALEEPEADPAEVAEASEGAKDLVASLRKEREELIEALRQWCDELEEIVDDAEGAEFPGMYG